MIVGKIAAEQGVQYVFDKFAADLRNALQIITDVPVARTLSDTDKAAMLPDKEYSAAELGDRIRRAIVATGVAAPSDKQIGEIAQVLTGIHSFTSSFLVENANDSSKKSWVAYPPFSKDVSARIQPMTVGKALQVLGTDCFRKFVGDNIWVDSFFRRWVSGGKKPTLVPDDRFLNETWGVRAVGGVSIYVTRPGHKEPDDGRSGSHPSENASKDFIADFDFHVVNDGSLESLEAKVRAIWPDIVKLSEKRVATS